MPKSVAISTTATRVPASRGGKNSRTMIGYDGTKASLDRRHRHGEEAPDAGDAQQHGERVRRQAERALDFRRRARASRRADRGWAPAQHQRERQHHRQADNADANVGRAPARPIDEMLQY